VFINHIDLFTVLKLAS